MDDRREVATKVKQMKRAIEAPENQLTLIVIGVTLTLLLLDVVREAQIPWQRQIFWFSLLAFEFWTILNKRRGDTLSEGVVELCARPLVPWIFGWLTCHYWDHITVLEQGVAMALNAHFFWQFDKIYRRRRGIR